MAWKRNRLRLFRSIAALLLALASLLLLQTARAQGAASPPPASPPSPSDATPDKRSDGMVKLRINVLNPRGAPVGNASVYVRFNESGGAFHHDKLAEMNFKTNQDGSVKVPPVPQGKIQIQVIATGWHTFGQWYDIDKAEETVTVKLEEPPHWY